MIVNDKLKFRFNLHRFVVNYSNSIGFIASHYSFYNLTGDAQDETQWNQVKVPSLNFY